MNKQWYVVTNNTSWCNVDEAVLSGPYTTQKEALSHCWDSSCWPELMTVEEALAKTF
jgi:hypothetical protein